MCPVVSTFFGVAESRSPPSNPRRLYLPRVRDGVEGYDLHVRPPAIKLLRPAGLEGCTLNPKTRRGCHCLPQIPSVSNKMARTNGVVHRRNGAAKDEQEKPVNGHITANASGEQKTDYSRWRLRDDDGCQTWHYLETDEELKSWPQSTADKYHLGLETVRAIAP